MENQFIINQGNSHQFLYKYRGFNKFLFSSLAKGEVYFADPADFNDPFDCDAVLAFEDGFDQNPEVHLEPLLRDIPASTQWSVRQGIRAYISEGNIQAIKDFMSETYRFNNGERNPHGLGIFCLAKAMDSLTHWSYYAEAHSGLCFEYEVGSPPFHMGKEVDYKADLLQFGPNVFKDRSVARQIISRKSLLWEHEGEVRYFRDKGPGVQKIQKSQLKKVFFGVRAKPKNIRKVKDLLARNGYTAELFVARRKSHSYGLDFDRLPDNYGMGRPISDFLRNLIWLIKSRVKFRA